MMPRRDKCYKILSYVLGLIVILILIVKLFTKNTKCIQFHASHRILNLDGAAYDVDLPMYDDNLPLNIEKILDKTRLNIKAELWNYNFTDSGVNKLEDLLTESGGRPIRNIIISTWRSGSTFLGELINAIPSSFYYFEPLLIGYHYKQIRGPPSANRAVAELNNFLRCNYSAIKEYFDYIGNHRTALVLNQFRQNRRIWKLCKYYKDLCFNANYASKICMLFPFQSMKVVRLRLRLVKDLLQDTELNVNVVLLVRDPRGVLESRLSHENFCVPIPTEIERKQNGALLQVPDCSNPELLCADMVSDYVAARRLSQEYPGRIMVLRFEDLIFNLNATTFRLLKFLRLSATQSVMEFLQTHTNVEADQYYSTFRLSREIPFKWKTLLDYDYVVEDIQEACKEAMKLWGYKKADNASHMASEEFYPLEPYHVQ